MVSESLFQAYHNKICVCWTYHSICYRVTIRPLINV